MTTCRKRGHWLRNGDGSKPWYLVNPKIAGKWMFIPLNVSIGIDPYHTQMLETFSNGIAIMKHAQLEHPLTWAQSWLCSIDIPALRKEWTQQKFLSPGGSLFCVLRPRPARALFNERLPTARICEDEARGPQGARMPSDARMRLPATNEATF